MEQPGQGQECERNPADLTACYFRILLQHAILAIYVRTLKDESRSFPFPRYAGRSIVGRLLDPV